MVTASRFFCINKLARGGQFIAFFAISGELRVLEGFRFAWWAGG